MPDKKPDQTPPPAKPEKTVSKEEKAKKAREKAAAQARKIAEATMSRYMSWVMSIKGRHAFRGQANAEWVVAASAYRRLVGNDPEKSRISGMFTGYLHDIVGESRMRFPELDNLSDMEIMAKLQHQGCATGLIDFTESPLVALWFACQPAQTRSGEGARGKVLAVPLDGKKAQMIGNREILQGKGNLSEFFPVQFNPENPNFWAWRPGDLDRRVISQQSLFLFGRPVIDEYNCRWNEDIPYADKEGILDLLEEMGVSETTLFSDFVGYAAANSHSKGYSTRRAEKFFSEAIEKDATDPYLYFYRGSFKRAHGDFDGAMKDYTRGIDVVPHRIKKFIQLGDVKAEEGDLYSAMKLSGDSYFLNTLRAEMHNDRGVILCDVMHKYQEAAEDFERCIQIRPDDEIPYVNIARVKTLTGDFEGALGAYDRAITEARYPVKAHILRGSARLKAGDYQGALSDGDQAIKLRPRFAAGFDFRGLVKSQIGDYAGAIADFSRAIELDPNDGKAYNNRGSAKADLGDHSGAVADFDRAIAVDPQDGKPRHNRALRKVEIGDVAGAIVDWKDAMRLAEKAGDGKLAAMAERNLAELDKPE